MINSRYVVGLLFTCLWLWTNGSFAAQTGLASSTAIAAESSSLAGLSPTDRSKSIEKKPFVSPAVSADPGQAAKPELVKPGVTKLGSGGHLANVALGLVFIVLLILALGWFMKRFNQGGMFNHSAIKIVAVTPLGTRERLLVVDISGQQLLIGVTATQINTLHVFSEPVVDADPVAGSSEFGRKLLAALQQKSFRQTPGTRDHPQPE